MKIVEIRPELHLILLEFGQAYLWNDAGALTLVDTGIAGSGADIAAAIGQLGHRRSDVKRVVLTHFHEDHCGGAAEISGWGDVTVLAHRLEAPVIRGAAQGAPPVLLDWERPLRESVPRLPPAPPVAVDRELEDGDTLDFGGGARVVWVPGHTDGSIAVHLPGPRVLFTGDIAANVGRTTPGVFNTDSERAFASFVRLAGLDAEVVCFGHGEPLLSGGSAALRAAASEVLPG